MNLPNRVFTTGMAAAALAVALPAGAAAAGPAASGHVQVEVIDIDDTTTETDFCGITGLTVEVNNVMSGRVGYSFRGADSIPYFTATFHNVTTFTEADGTTVTIRSNVLRKDQRIVQNPDGTFTITELNTGGFLLKGPSGMLRNPGMIRGQFIVDPNGTPQNPDDDIFVAELEPIGESTGLNETGEFCADYRLVTGRDS